MEESFVWITTRQIKPGSLGEFEQAWRPERYPEGMHHAYAYWTEDGQEVTGVSFWDSRSPATAGALRQRRVAGGPRWHRMSPPKVRRSSGAVHSRCPSPDRDRRRRVTLRAIFLIANTARRLT